MEFAGKCKAGYFAPVPPSPASFPCLLLFLLRVYEGGTKEEEK